MGHRHSQCSPEIGESVLKVDEDATVDSPEVSVALNSIPFHNITRIKLSGLLPKNHQDNHIALVYALGFPVSFNFYVSMHERISLIYIVGSKLFLLVKTYLQRESLIIIRCKLFAKLILHIHA